MPVSVFADSGRAEKDEKSRAVDPGPCSPCPGPAGRRWQTAAMALFLTDDPFFFSSVLCLQQFLSFFSLQQFCPTGMDVPLCHYGLRHLPRLPLSFSIWWPSLDLLQSFGFSCSISFFKGGRWVPVAEFQQPCSTPHFFSACWGIYMRPCSIFSLILRIRWMVLPAPASHWPFHCV